MITSQLDFIELFLVDFSFGTISWTIHSLYYIECFGFIITLCMKLSLFCHTNSGQLFCNCPLFVIALVPGLIFGGKPEETCCHSVVASKWLKTRASQFALQDENTTT